MNDLAALYGSFAESVMLLAISTVRLVATFLVTPIFSDELVPPLVRNAVFVALGIVVALLQPLIDIASLSALDWLGLFAKEVFIGIAIGFFFSLFLWAFEAAGTIIDTQIGTAMATVYDPISGHDVTLYGDFVGRWINYLFIASGGLLLLTLAVLQSYAVWPIDRLLPSLEQASRVFFAEHFSRFVSLILMLSSPIVVVLFVVDMSMGLINRFAKRLDILFISLALKGLIVLLMMIMLIPVLVEIFLAQLEQHDDNLRPFLERVLGG